ncbi:MAG: hypothetical protein OSA93_17305 [Akkermansiaceae bacterium]|jgi:transposase|nr:hypothetical protein [Akkermansiaceae bacterium]
MRGSKNKTSDEASQSLLLYVAKLVVWNLYLTLLRAEAGFKMLKSALGLRPNFHQIEKHVEGHIFIRILAYH